MSFLSVRRFCIALAATLCVIALSACSRAQSAFAPTSAAIDAPTPATLPDELIGQLAPSPNLLAPDTVSVTLTITTALPARCRLCDSGATIERIPDYEAMTQTMRSPDGLIHSVDATAWQANRDRRILVRCTPDDGTSWDANDVLRTTHLRALNHIDPDFPRTGNLWGSWELRQGGISHLARLDLLLGADPLTPDQMRRTRVANPDILILTSVNTVENSDLPEDYYLHDTSGERIEVWPGAYRLNLTKPYVAEYQAHFAFQTLLDHDMQADGVFFDNYFVDQSWLSADIYGDSVQIDADEDGLPDDRAALDAAWRQGVLYEMAVFRDLTPHAIVCGHSARIDDLAIPDQFNGIGIPFATADVIQGDRSFADLYGEYSRWNSRARDPRITLIESSPLDEIAYGYDYAPWDKIPDPTLAFARDHYPWMRFGLCLTLLSDGYFAHEIGDTWHGNDWWYDELDVDLGYPLGPAERISIVGGVEPAEMIENGDFESGLTWPWEMWVDVSSGNRATLNWEATEAARGDKSARIDITETAGADWQIDFAQHKRELIADTDYDLSFWAKADRERTISLSCQKDKPDWDSYGLWQTVTVDEQWRQHTVTFRATQNANDARIQFLLGAAEGSVWLDGVSMTAHPTDLYRREYEGGLVLLNGTHEPQTVEVERGYSRFVGAQAPRVQAIRDNADPGFSATGDWQPAQYDSGQWQASGPFYHDWGSDCLETVQQGATAEWSLPIDATDTYTVSVWYPAAPQSVDWTQSAMYEIVDGGQVRASTTINQSQGGDQWHTVGVVELNPISGVTVRLTSSGDAPCVADAVYVQSADRYNDGSPVESITLAPMDGIVLVRDQADQVYLPAME